MTTGNKILESRIPTYTTSTVKAVKIIYKFFKKDKCEDMCSLVLVCVYSTGFLYKVVFIPPWYIIVKHVGKGV